MSFKRVRSFPLFPNPKELSANNLNHGGDVGPSMDVDGPMRVGNKRSYFRSGPRPQQVCSFWLEGRCNRDPCNFLHTDDPSLLTARSSNPINGAAHKRSNVVLDERDSAGNAGAPAVGARRNVWGRLQRSKAGKVQSDAKRRSRVCTFFVRGDCVRGNQCNFLHSFTSTPDMSLMTQLTGHEKAVRAIALPAGATKLYTGGQDQTIRIWDCETGQCNGVVPMGGDVGCLLTESGWLFVGLPNEVKALNLQNNAVQRLEGPKGQVHALAVSNDMLLAGAQDGNVLAWKFNSSVGMFQPAASLWGHSAAVVTLESAEGKLYSGSMDKTIKVWDLSTGQCIQTLEGHTHVVMGLLCWNQFLLSGSLDGTVKVWAAGQTGKLEWQYSYPEDSSSNETLDGVLTFCGFVDIDNKAILLCSFNDNTVHLLELPSFTERGVLFSKDEVRSLQVGPGGLVFSGDSGGGVKVWKWAPLSSSAAEH